MKKFLILLLFIFTLLSCKKDDEKYITTFEVHYPSRIDTITVTTNFQPHVIYYGGFNTIASYRSLAPLRIIKTAKIK